MNKILKPIIRPLFLGFLFYLFILLGFNAHIIAQDSIKTWTAIIAGILFIYLVVYAAIKKPGALNVGGIGFYITHILFSICMPIFLIVNKVFFPEPNINESKSIFEMDKIEFISNPSDCIKKKYGSFLTGIDTIIRYSEDNNDYEKIITVGLDSIVSRVKWLDSCSYIRVSEKGVVSDYVLLGNINGTEHQMYVKPAFSKEWNKKIIKILSDLKQ